MVAVEPVFATNVDHVVPSGDLSILYPVIAEPPLFDGVVQERLIWEDEEDVAVRPVGAPGTLLAAAFTSIAISSHESPFGLAVQLQVAEPGDGSISELDAPVIAFCTLTSHPCVQVGEPSVTPPYIAGRSSIMLFENFVVIDIAGLLAVPCCAALVGIGVVWSTPEIEYAPTTADVGPDIVTITFPVPLGFTRYQNSASLLVNDDAAWVICTPPNVTEAALPLFAATPTTSSRLLPVPALTLASVN